MVESEEQIYEELLVLRAQEGNLEAFEALVRRWQQRLWGHARRLTDDREAAWDAIQDAWVAIVRGIRNLDDPARFSHWAYRIVTHKCADWTRRRERQRKLAAAARDGVVESPAVPDDDSSDVDRLRSALRRLPPRQRAILSLRYLDELGTNVIAVILDIPAGTVKSRLHHARNHLKSVLERTKT